MHYVEIGEAVMTSKKLTLFAGHHKTYSTHRRVCIHPNCVDKFDMDTEYPLVIRNRM